MPLSGKTCIITGASYGIGRAIAHRFGEAGGRLMLADSNEKGLEEVRSALAEDGLEVQTFCGDLREKLCTANLLSATLDVYDSVDVLVNGARVISREEDHTVDSDLMSHLFESNVAANLRLSMAFAQRIRKQTPKDAETPRGAGAIVNLTSIVADRSMRNLAAFSVASAALNQLTRALAVAFAEDQIRVNAVALGSVMSSSLGQACKKDPDLRHRLIAATPMNRIGEAEEAADTALFLASPAASFITGQILACDGGRSILEPADLPNY